MAEKDDQENLEDDLGQQKRQFLLELSTVLQDRVPSPGIAFARTIQSNNAISDMILFSFLLLTVSAPPDTGRWKSQQDVPDRLCTAPRT